MRAALYARVSTEKQKDENTVDTQINEVKSAIEQDNNTLSPDNIYVDEGWSGAYIDRPSLDKLRQDAREHKFEIVYVYDKGRLSRRYIHQEIVIDEFRKQKIEFKSLHDINGKSAEEQVMSGVMGIFHEYERTKTAERFRLSKMNKVRNGHLLGYNPPYGYNYIPVKGRGLDKQNGYFEVNNEESKIVEKIFRWVGNEGAPLREVIRRLYDEGIPPRKGKRAAWTKSSVVRLLRNETYVGNHYYNKSEAIEPLIPSKDRKHFRHTDKTSRRMRNKSEWLIVKVPSIIESSLFKRAQSQLDKNMILSPRNTRNEYLFAGLTYCTCGTKRTGEGARGHLYYRCTQRLKTFPEPPTCKERGINAQAMDSAIWEKLVIMLTEPHLLSEQLERYLEKREESSLNEPAIVSLRKDLASLADEEKRYVSAYGRGTLDEKVFDDSMRILNKKKYDMSSRLEHLEQSRPKPIPNIDIEDLTKDFTHLLNDIDFNMKKKVVQRLVERITATKEEVTVCGNIQQSTPYESQKAVLHAKHRNRRSPKCW